MASKSKTIYCPASSTYGYTLSVSFTENSTNTANNTSNITATASLGASSAAFSVTNGGTLNLYWHDDRTNTDTLLSSLVISQCGKTSSVSYGTKSTSKTLDVTHKADGTLSGYAYASWSKDKTNNYIPASGSVQTDWTALTTIPRYANFTSHYVSGATDNSVTVYWNADASCDYIQYSLNGGAWTDTSGYPTYTIGGLSSGTSYSIKTRIRRADSGLWTESGTIYATTLGYASITEFFLTVASQTSIKVNWATNVARDWTQYRINGGSWIDAWDSVSSDNKSGNFYIFNLNPGTQYSVQIRVRRTDSGLWSESGVLYATTKDYVVKIKVNGAWKNAIPYVKANGVWKKAIPYMKVNGVWKVGID